MIPSSLDPRPLWHIFIEHERHDCGEVLSKANEWNPGHVLHWRGRTGRPTMAGGCAFGSWINSHFLLHFSSFFFAVLFFCCLRPKCFLRRFDLVRWRFGLRPATRPATRQTRVVPCRCRWLQARSSSQSQCLDANCELEDVYFYPKGGMIPVRQSHVHHVGRCWKMNHKLQIFVKPQMEL